MKAAVAVLSLVAAVGLAAPQEGYNYPTPGGPGLPFPGSGSGSGQGQYPSVPAQYSFKWDVNDPPSSNFYGHQEQREDANTQGSYYVQLPDGRRLIVEYYVDASGYHPTITFEGEAQYPSGPGSGAGAGFGSGSGLGGGYSLPGTGSGGVQAPSQSYGPPAK
ncbi:pro-resilin-like [Penaeus chinensis]|uniref:pro-resilin-like n=1 Tax=Penaeus chinensis TaxID=139456 RepID=UPI001FB59C92|nr:pro-resilin-like [Penaeus chinensis]